MPLIGGNKYSCEPCIRGHRATHCMHTDRILIEVRKPGRPLDRCAHAISTCSCARHLKNSTVVQVKVKERSTSPVVKQNSDGSDVTEVEATTKTQEQTKTKTLMISKEMPFARELRLSPPGTMTTTNESSAISSEEEEEEEDLKSVMRSKRKSSRGAVTSTSEKTSSESAERRKGKVIKRHRLNKTDIPSPLLTTSNAMDVDVCTPALSPSISESGSERSLPAYFDRMETSSMEVVQEQPRRMVEKVPAVVFRGISISELLT